jgi:alpha-galactosidase
MGYPGPGHIIEFYSWATRAPSQDDLPYGIGEEAKQHGFDESSPMPERKPVTPEVRRAFLADYAAIIERTQLPERGQTDAVSEEGVARLIGAIAHGRREVFIVNVANHGAIPNLPAEAVVEIEGVTDSAGVRAVTVGACPPVLKGLLEKRFAWQELVVDAAVTGDRALALQALMLDEMAIHPDQAEDMLDELLEASRDLLPQFFT